MSGPQKATQVATPSSETPTPEPARATILVETGTPELVLKAIGSHASLAGKEVPKQFRVTIAKESSGAIVVKFPDGAPPYDIVNLIGWLNNPPEIVGVSNAKGWITSPSTGLRYSLKPEAGNEWGDTLVGVSSDGNFVRVYLPDATMCEISQAVIADTEPDSEAEGVEPTLTINIAMDVNVDFGNPGFKITHPRDTDWSP